MKGLRSKATGACIAFAVVAASVTAPSAEPQTGHGRESTDPVITSVAQGSLLGYRDDGVYTFKGIPYAASERFGLPTTPPAWSGVRPALQYGEVCPTGTESVSPFDFMTPTGKDQVENEKCQSVNVWTKSLRTEARRPVVVWLHGGGFSSGSSSELPYYDGRNLADHGNTVFVSVNHRLNVLGYMDLSAHGEAYRDSGNLGMLDIESALKWVRDNITRFGGDPKNVTVVGQSGGAAKVLTLMGMPSAKGLFHKAVVASGQAAGRSQSDARAQTAAVFGELGVNTVEQLKQVPHRTLLAAAGRARFSASPVIDGALYPERTVTADGKFSALSRDVPLMVSNTFAEFSTNAGAMITQAGAANPLQDAYRPQTSEARVLQLLNERYKASTPAIVTEFRKQYPTRPLFDLLYMDAGGPANRLPTARAKAGQGGAPVYAAVYAWTLPVFGGVTAYHTGGDLPFMLDNVDTVRSLVAGKRHVADKVAAEASGALIRFAATGDPGERVRLDWPAYDSATGWTMVFDARSSARRKHDERLFELISRAR
ncbi:carboxylesterase family protein [Lentzea sp. BCCO 10_0798]|uniref:Carboxylic ester hydrolase n=1 Tax=Lentzea kristufekii TaxID=3095430 RepID=A0ABU4U7H1_9PSEU|nr:carboxylesterase family protein [Lentzea sp. BCCO 10_0798]MDX8056542.1 carboxylesterase family protein [Lentzea sp. BCCO 10_0798]